jgi:hypothetical protein
MIAGASSVGSFRRFQFTAFLLDLYELLGKSFRDLPLSGQVSGKQGGVACVAQN